VEIGFHWRFLSRVHLVFFYWRVITETASDNLWVPQALSSFLLVSCRCCWPGRRRPPTGGSPRGSWWTGQDLLLRRAREVVDVAHARRVPGLTGRVCGLGLTRATKWAVLFGPARHDRVYTVPCSGRGLSPSDGTARHD
jgi:hypothetical protein